MPLSARPPRSSTEREAAGIADALTKPRPGHPDNETMTTWIERRIPEDEIREDFFIHQTLTEAQVRLAC
jgi:hypothetical protein